ncbi:MAG: LamG domain-containing protein, partial [Candidatus Micrarchaeota archaeon]|nr:LamG domain-containing protein [Candidatus Micrarchaeota archaeon]
MRIWYLFALLILAISIVSVNASVTVPANIIAYLPVTLTNYQGAALATNTPIAIGVLNAFTGNVIGFNATKYQQYETCNLNNAEFFYANGTIITSWLEGNVLNENTANSVCSSSSSSNALSASSNVLYWIRIGSNAANFLPANTGTATTNTVYLGWAGNVVSAANTLFNGNTVGEAPQLSCSNAYSTATCNGVYGQYDNGNSVFSFYDNFVGGTLNSNYWSNGGGGATLTVANSIEVTGTTDDIWLYGQIPTTTQVIDTDLVSGTSGFMQLRLGYSDLANQHTRYDSVSDFGTVGNNYQIESAFGACCGTDTSLPAGLIEPYVQSFGWIGTGKLFSYINYENRLVSTDTTYAYSSPSYPGMLITYSSPGTSFTTLIQWVRSRINPPANTLPGTSFGTVQTISSEPTPTISVSNIMIDGNQYINITAYTNGGTGPYTYNFIISNSVTNSIVASQRYTGVSASSNSFFWQVPNTYAGNTLGVNVVVSGSFSSTANSIETAPLVVSKQLQGVGWTASNTAWEAGQNIPVTLTSTVSGGTNAITYGQFNGNGNYITVNKEYFQGNSFTILAWVYWPSSTNLAGGCGSNNDCGYAWSGPASTNQGFGIFSRGDLWYLNFYDDDLECSTGPSNNQWYQFGASWNSTTKNRVIWVNGASACSGTSGGNLVTSSPLIIGSAAGTWDTSASMEGSIANLQLYNTSLSASQISSLYQEGIEGAPISFNSLVGWWDLNGNENFNGANVTDYSSNQIYGTPTAVPYVTSTNTFTYNDIIYASNGMIIANSLDVMTSATSNAFTFSAAGFP